MGAGQTRRVIVLGSTGSIGTQTLEVISHLNGLHARDEWETTYEIVALTAGGNERLLPDQVARFGVQRVVSGRPDGAAAAERVANQSKT